MFINRYRQLIYMLLNNDIIIYICQFVSNCTKVKFLSANRELHMMKNKVPYNEMVLLDRISNFWYRDQIMHICVDVMYFDILPKYITHITFGHYFNRNMQCFNRNMQCFIPSTVTHVKFGCFFNQDIKDCIPLNVTHLTFGFHFNKDIRDCIPSNVTHLKFGHYFNQDIRDCIPHNVTHLTFGYYFDRDIENCIPFSVTHLKFGAGFKRDIRGCLPPNVKYLTLSNFYPYVSHVPSTVIVKFLKHGA